MARSSLPVSHQRAQLLTSVRLAVCAIVGAALAWAYLTPAMVEPAPAEHPAALTAGAKAPTMRDWLAASEPFIRDLVDARNDLATAAGGRNISKTGVACQATRSALTSLKQQLPSPDPALNATLRQAIASYEAGLPSCILGATTQDGDGLRRAATYIGQGDAAMQSALDIVRDSQTHDAQVQYI